jgi:hypothetical protein
MKGKKAGNGQGVDKIDDDDGSGGDTDGKEAAKSGFCLVVERGSGSKIQNPRFCSRGATS